MTSQNDAIDAILKDAAAHADKRKYHRVKLSLQVRYLLPNGKEYTGRVHSISPVGAFIRAHPGAQQGDKVVLYIENLGRFEAKVIHVAKAGFAVALKTHKSRTLRTADTLTWLLNGGKEKYNQRLAERVRQDKPATIVLSDGTACAGTILDISTTGASIFLDPLPAIGDTMTVGKMQARVVRHHAEGVGVIFAMDEALTNQ